MKTKTAEPGIPYHPQEIEPRWQEAWGAVGVYRTPETTEKEKFYCLDYFPYPSGEGLHVGHCRNYVPTDLISRYKRMRGYRVLHPMGWDAFGEPTEHHAVLMGISPRETTDRNTANYKRQLKMIGTSYDWEREIDSSSPDYYRWTQAMFLWMYRKGLAYRDTNWQWWCPSCATTLSSHEIQGEKCWRGHSGVTKKEIPAWYFKITAYADELISGLDHMDWPEAVKTMQRNWIGRSEGVEVTWEVVDEGRAAGHEGGGRGVSIGTFTTRVDTIYGVTFLALAPEHPALMALTAAEQKAAVEAYVGQAIAQAEYERAAEGREVTGVFSGAFARHPLTGEALPVYVADYVIPTYGSGAVMGVPAHDGRDFQFAQKFGLEVRMVIVPEGEDGSAITQNEEAYAGPGVMVNSGPFDGIASTGAQELIAAALEKAGAGVRTVHTHLRDWLISRQRYWGTPIPIVHCDRCGTVPVPEEELPVRLPKMEDFTPDGSGASPLARVEAFVHTTCPNCGGSATRETDTMGGFACSSWYFLRFTSPDYEHGPFEPAAMKSWMPVDLYVGGTEHAVLHLLYARFWTKFLADEGYLPFREPFAKLINQGQLHGPDGQRMSKSRGNVIVPDAVVREYGADALRVHCLFMAPFENRADWQEDGMVGARRFLNKVWSLVQDYGLVDAVEPVVETAVDPDLEKERHRVIKVVSQRIEDFRFNTMVSSLMEFVNLLAERARQERWHTTTFRDCLETTLILLAPAAPHITEELWRLMGRPFSIHQQAWPRWEEAMVIEQTRDIAVQVNGRKKGLIRLAVSAREEEAVRVAREDPEISKIFEREVVRTVYVPGKILNIVTTE